MRTISQSMQLEDLLPEAPEFYVSSKKKTYRLRLPNLEDRARFKELLGSNEAIQKAFGELQWDVLAKLVYRLLEDKNDFLAQEFDDVNDDGQKVRVMVTGPALLMRSITSQEEAIKMLGALTTALRLSDPLVDQLVNLEVKKNLNENPTGQKSST